jgi:aminoglycoside phosphotransferase (APT) family kinase protein
MHADEVDTDVALVGRLLARQFPRWSGLPLAPVRSFGTDHDVYRLGDSLVIRLPRIGWAAGQAEKEARILPQLAPRLPLAVPVPLGVGRPDDGYPFPWAVHEWLPGADASTAPFDRDRAALDLAAFVRALRSVATADPPPAATRLADRDADVRRCVRELGNRIDAGTVVAEWDRCLAAPAHEGPGRWAHGDLLPGNLLVVDGRLSAVIDWGGLGTGDPAPDLCPGFWLFEGGAREAYKDTVGYDDAAWRRARGWIIAPSVNGVDYYAETFPAMAQRGLDGIRDVIEDFASTQ